jgi:hypothetical protein
MNLVVNANHHRAAGGDYPFSLRHVGGSACMVLLCRRLSIVAYVIQLRVGQGVAKIQYIAKW